MSLRPQGRTSTAADPFDGDMFAKRNDRRIAALVATPARASDPHDDEQTDCGGWEDH